MDGAAERGEGVQSGYWNSCVEEEARCLVREVVKRLKAENREEWERAEFVLKSVMEE